MTLYNTPLLPPWLDPLNRVASTVFPAGYRGSIETFFYVFYFFIKNFSKKFFELQPDLKNFRKNNLKNIFFSEKKVGFLLFFSTFFDPLFPVFLPDFMKTHIFIKKRPYRDHQKKVLFFVFSG